MLNSRFRLPYRESKLRGAKKAFSSHFQLTYLIKGHQKNPRFLIQASKGKVKKAVTRNRIKRLVSEALRFLLKEEQVPSVNAMVRLVNPFRQELTLGEIKGELGGLLSKIK